MLCVHAIFLRALIGYLKFWAFSDTKNWSQFNSRIVEAIEYSIRTHVLCQLQISKKCFQNFHTKDKKIAESEKKALNKTDVFFFEFRIEIPSHIQTHSQITSPFTCMYVEIWRIILHQYDMHATLSWHQHNALVWVEFFFFRKSLSRC